jgi:prepilin-type N-terminal cleavage/methylation domain-containing protein
MPTPRPTTQPRASRNAFTLLECMIVMTILSIMALGAATGLGSLCHVPNQNDNQLVASRQLIDRMEQLRGTAFGDLASGSSGGITWTVTPADPTGGTNPQADFVQVTVTNGSRCVSCYVTQP